MTVRRIPDAASATFEGKFVLMDAEVASNENANWSRVGAMLGIAFGVVVLGCAAASVWTLESPGEGVEPLIVESGLKSSITARLDEAAELVRRFHQAGTAEAKGRFVLPFPSIESFLDFHYSVQGKEPSKVVAFTNMGIYETGSRRFCALQGHYERGNPFLAMVEALPGGDLKTDWQAFKGMGEVTWSDFLTNTSYRNVIMRLLAMPDDYFAYDYADDGEYACYRLADISEEKPCYGYVRRRSVAGQELAKLYGQTRAIYLGSGSVQSSVPISAVVPSTQRATRNA
ncbi:MAG: hypothetical protein ACI8T1_000875 [Verrucomicrobiales bacterium]